jgi:hypothetical protein
VNNRNISRTILSGVIETQNHLCIYCQLPFGTVCSTKRGDIIQNAVADHWIPWASGAPNIEENCVASCQLCNSIKSSQLFESIDHARVAILAIRFSKRISVRWIPISPVTENPESWSCEYSGYLASLLSDIEDD